MNNTPHDPWENAHIPEEHGIQTAIYPFAQWVNGQKAFQKVHPVLGSGGWAIPVEQIGGLIERLPAGFSAGELPHKNGDSTPAFLTSELQLAIIAARFAWVMRGLRGQVVLPEYVEGAKGKVQALCVVRGLESLTTPVMVTLSGMASRSFTQTSRQFRQQVLAPASALAKRPLPAYAFWMAVRAGPAVNVGSPGKQSPITPPMAGWDSEALKDAGKRRAILGALFVGQAVIDFCAAHWDEARAWAEQLRAQSGQTEAEPEPGEELPAPPAEEEDIPF